MNLPNKITTFRMICVVFIAILLLIPTDGILVVPFFELPITSIIAWVLFIVASISDFVDGYIARKYNLVTDYGKFMDPIADKLLVNSLFIILTCWGLVPLGVLLIVICRDIIVDAIRMVMCEKNVVVAANIFGKLKTVVQMIAIPFVLVYPLIFKDIADIFPLDTFLCYIAALASLLSGVIYFMQAKDVVLEGATK